MGRGIYSQDVATEARSSERDAFAYSAYQVTDGAGATRRGVHPTLSPFRTVREVNNETPIVVALDVTRSRGEDTKVMYAKLPMLMGQLELHGYVAGPGVSFAAIGDCDADQAPLQVGQFEGDNRLDEMISRLWIEEGGGGTGQESYELCAYYYARTNCTRLRDGHGHKGYFFFVGDEGFFPQVSREHVRRVIGEEIESDLPAAEAFRRLHEKFDVFLIYPGKTLQQRRSDIDAEIRQRVTAAGGTYDNVDVRASLIWNNRNDLDLHVFTPGGEEIYYGHKRSRCGGWLDVDMNVRGETDKPVENVRWVKDQAPAGRYRICVQNYAFREQKHVPTPYKVEIEVDGIVKHFEGTISQKMETGPSSSLTILELDYDPNAKLKIAPAPHASTPDPYAAYSDEVILKQWGGVLAPGHILRVEDPSAIVDVILGTLAVREGKKELRGYIDDMRGRGQSPERINEVNKSLSGVTARPVVGHVEGEIPKATPPDGSRPSRSRRL